jgi:transposase-like protein
MVDTFYADVARDARDIRSGKLRLCDSCGAEGANVKNGTASDGSPRWLCIDCVPDEALHG